MRVQGDSLMAQTDVGKSGGQTNLLTEGENGGRFLGGRIGELQSGQNAKGDFFAVVKRMGFRQGGETIVNGMGGR